MFKTRSSYLLDVVKVKLKLKIQKQLSCANSRTYYNRWGTCMCMVGKVKNNE